MLYEYFICEDKPWIIQILNGKEPFHPDGIIHVKKHINTIPVNRVKDK